MSTVSNTDARPHVICHMISSIDGGLHPDNFTASPDGDWAGWQEAYGRVNETLSCDGWIVGRVTFAEMHLGSSHPPETFAPVNRRVHIALPGEGGYAVVLDTSGKLHFGRERPHWQNVIALLGNTVPDSHLAELVEDGVSYIVSDTEDINLERMLETLRSTFLIQRLALLGGAAINGSFFAAGLVDELSVLVAPALDGRAGAQRFVEAGTEGLRGKTMLSSVKANIIEDGLVHLLYQVGAEKQKTD